MAQSGASSKDDKLSLGNTEEKDEDEFSRGMSAEDGSWAGNTDSDAVTDDPVPLEIRQSIKEEGVALSREEGVVGKGSLDPCSVWMISEFPVIVSTTVASDEGKTWSWGKWMLKMLSAWLTRCCSGDMVLSGEKSIERTSGDCDLGLLLGSSCSTGNGRSALRRLGVASGGKVGSCSSLLSESGPVSLLRDRNEMI